MFGEKTRTVVVVGAQWGDEGKGKLVDVLVRDGVDVEGRLYVSDRAHLVLPYHKLLDSEDPANKAIGTTGRGIGPAYEDKVARRGVRVLDLRHDARLRELVGRGVDNANAQLAFFGSEARVGIDDVMGLLRRLAERLLPLAEDVGLMIHRARGVGAAVLLEGAQGSLLDVDHGTYPFVTSSNTTSGGAAVGAGIAPTAFDAILGIVKAYTTRVGNGPLPTEMDEPLGGGRPSRSPPGAGPSPAARGGRGARPAP